MHGEWEDVPGLSLSADWGPREYRQLPSGVWSRADLWSAAVFKDTPYAEIEYVNIHFVYFF